MNQPSLFDLGNLAATVVVPQAPALVPHEWPFPGMTPENSARAAVANSPEYADMLAAVILAQGAGAFTSKQVLSFVPTDWRELCGEYAHGSLDFRHGEERGIVVKYVAHDDGGFHFTYQGDETNQARG